MKKRMFASYGAVAVVTAVAATVLAAGEPEVKAVETHVNWSAALDWATTAEAADASAAAPTAEAFRAVSDTTPSR